LETLRELGTIDIKEPAKFGIRVRVNTMAEQHFEFIDANTDEHTSLRESGVPDYLRSNWSRWPKLTGV
jgi:hypothetical protein